MSFYSKDEKVLGFTVVDLYISIILAKNMINVNVYMIMYIYTHTCLSYYPLVTT